MFPNDLNPLWLSLKVGIISTLVVFICGVLLARVMTRYVFWGRSIIDALITLPLVLPPTVMGFILLLVFGKKGPVGKLLYDTFGIEIVFTPTAAVLSAIVVAFPLMYQSAKGAFLSVESNLEKAARTLGASESYLFWKVTIPLAWSSLLAGCVLSFARALGEFGATLMLAGNIPGKTETIPLAIYFAVEAGDISRAQFWVGIITLLGFCMILWLNWWTQRQINRLSLINRGGIHG